METPTWVRKPWFWVAVFILAVLLSRLPEPIVAILLIGGVVAAIWLKPFIQTYWAWEQLAREAGGAFIPGRIDADEALAVISSTLPEGRLWQLITCPFRDCQVDVPTQGTTISAALGARADGDQGSLKDAKYLSFRAEIHPSTPMVFQLSRGMPLMAGTGMAPFRTGDEVVDREYVLTATKPDLAAAIVSSPALLDEILRMAPTEMGLAQEGRRYYLYLHEKGTGGTPARLLALHTLFTRLVEATLAANERPISTEQPTAPVVSPAESSAEPPAISPAALPAVSPARSMGEGVPSAQDPAPSGAASRKISELSRRSGLGWDSIADSDVSRVEPVTPPATPWVPMPGSIPPTPSPAGPDSGSTSPDSIVAGSAEALVPVGTADSSELPSFEWPLEPATELSLATPIESPLEPAPVLSPATPSEPRVTLAPEHSLTPPVDPIPSGGWTMDDTLATEQWEVTVRWIKPYEEVAPGAASGAGSDRLLVAEIVFRNLQRYTGTLTTSGIALHCGDGRAYAPAGQTATIEKGFWLDWVQSGSSAEHRVVFEVPGDAAPRKLLVLGMTFELTG